MNIFKDVKKKYEKFLVKVFHRYLRTLGYSKYLSRYLFRIAQSAIYVAIVLILINLFFLVFGEPVTSSSLGSFGDFLGGTLNPIFTFLMLIGLIITIVLQKIELSLARKEFSRTADSLEAQNINIEIQRFENTFFSLLEFFDSCRNDVEHFSNNDRRGRDAFKGLYTNFVSTYLQSFEKNDKGPGKHKVFKPEAETLQGVKSLYDDFYKGSAGEDLGAYFRTLYNILKLIDETKAIQNKKLYTNLLRSQLSRYELLILFYNTLSSYGELKMKGLVIKYEILKHLETTLLPQQNLNLLKEFS